MRIVTRPGWQSLVLVFGLGLAVPPTMATADTGAWSSTVALPFDRSGSVDWQARTLAVARPRGGALVGAAASEDGDPSYWVGAARQDAVGHFERHNFEPDNDGDGPSDLALAPRPDGSVVAAWTSSASGVVARH
jgi:hypothetical protein